MATNNASTTTTNTRNPAANFKRRKSDKEIGTIVRQVSETIKTLEDIEARIAKITENQNRRALSDSTAGNRSQGRSTTQRKAIDTRGYRPRNGRWDMMNKLFDDKGLDADPMDLFEEANKRSLKLGISELSKPSFYSMLSVARKNAGLPNKRASRSTH